MSLRNFKGLKGTKVSRDIKVSKNEEINKYGR